MKEKIDSALLNDVKIIVIKRPRYELRNRI